MNLASKFLILGFVFSFVHKTYGVEHISFSLKNDGIKKVLSAVLEDYKKENRKPEFTLEAGAFSGKVAKSSIESNPIIQQLTSYIHIPIEKDLSFYVNWSPIKIEGEVDKDQVKFESFGRERKFETTMLAVFTDLKISGEMIEFCEFASRDSEGNVVCNEKKGMYGRFENFELALKPGEVLKFLIQSHGSLDYNQVSLEFDRTLSNLKPLQSKSDHLLMTKFGISPEIPKFHLDFQKFYMPPTTLIIDGNRIELGLDEIKDALLSEREFLAQMLTSFAGDFVAEDFIEIVNEFFVCKLKDIKTKYELVNFVSHRHSYTEFIEIFREDPRRAVTYMMHGKSKDEMTHWDRFISIFKQTIYRLKTDIEFKSLKTQRARDIIGYFATTFNVNRKKYEINHELRNGQGELSEFNLDEVGEDHDFAFSLSEPFFNTISKAAQESGLLNVAFSRATGLKGVYLNGLNFHFESYDNSCELSRVKVVANMRIRLSKLEGEGFGDNFKYKIAEYLESEYGTKYYILPYRKEKDLFFPIELSFSIALMKHADKTLLYLSPDNSFASGELLNSYDYPISDMTNTVKNGVYDGVKEALMEVLAEPYELDVTDYIKQIPGFDLDMNGLYISKTGHIVLTFDINKIKLKELQQGEEDE